MIQDWAQIGMMAMSLTASEAEASDLEQYQDEVQQIDCRSLLHDEQLKFWDDDSRVKGVLGGRQGGKTFLLAAWLLDAALNYDKTLNLYVALTKDSARDIVWPEFKTVAELLGLDPMYLHDHTLTVGPLPNGSVIRCKGSDDRKAIEAYRGIKVKRLAIDEMGSQPDFIQYFVDLMWPTMAKHNGQMALAGTPGLILDGYWWEITRDDRTSKMPVYRWTIFENPGIPQARDFVLEYLDNKLEGLTPEMLEPYRPGAEPPKRKDEVLAAIAVDYFREWYAEWIQDEGTIVFPLRDDRNWADALPTKTHTGVTIDPSDWRYVIGLDPGNVDKTAFSVVAGHPELIDRFVVRCETIESAIPTQVAARMWGLYQEYAVNGRPPKFVVDVNGLGKGYAEQASVEHGIPYWPAKKQDKASAVRFLRGRVISGRMKLIRGAAKPLSQCWSKLPWDEKKLLPKDVDDDESDATLYADRDFWPVKEEAVKPYEQGSEPYRRQQAEDMKAEAMRRAAERNREDWWDA